MREDAVVVRRDGGIGNDSARLKRWITACRAERTCSRVRRRGSASGSGSDDGGSRGREGLRDDVLGDFGWLLSLLGWVGEEGKEVGGGEDGARPKGTKDRIVVSRSPLVERDSARERASPRRSSTS